MESRWRHSKTVVPAKAGTHRVIHCSLWNMDPRLRGDDTVIMALLTA
jgi:hypothetical protein